MSDSGKSNPNAVSQALMGKAVKPDFAGKSKGASLNNVVPSVNSGLKAMAFNHRKKIKLG